MASLAWQSVTSPTERREQLKAVYEQAKGCTRCPLHQTRTTVVFGSGNADADLMFVGEAPGANEDKQGLPFVGQAGKLLTKLLGEIGLDRDEVFICNTVKCRPPNNRDPHPNEIESCNEYLRRQVELIQPTVICTLGNFSTKLLRGDNTGISRLHGQAGGAHDRRPRHPALPALSPRGGALHALDARGSAGRLPAGSRTFWPRERPEQPVIEDEEARTSPVSPREPSRRHAPEPADVGSEDDGSRGGDAIRARCTRIRCRRSSALPETVSARALLGTDGYLPAVPDGARVQRSWTHAGKAD